MFPAKQLVDQAIRNTFKSCKTLIKNLKILVNEFVFHILTMYTSWILSCRTHNSEVRNLFCKHDFFYDLKSNLAFHQMFAKKQTYPQIVTACNRDFNICNLITLLCVLLAPPITYMSLQPEVILLAFGCFFNGLPMHGGVQTDISSPKSSSHFQCKIVSHSHGDDALAQRASRFRA